MEMLAEARARHVTQPKGKKQYVVFSSVAAACLLVFLCLLFLANYRPQIKDAFYITPDGMESKIELPCTVYLGEAPFSIRFKLIYLPFFTPAVYQIIGDDEVQSITVNHSSYSFADLLAGKENDWMKGFSLNLADVLQTGENDIQIFLKNLGGAGGLRINTSSMDPVLLSIMTIFCLALCVPGYLFLRKWTGNNVISLVLCLAFLIRVIYSFTVNYIVRGYDVWGHIAYIEYIAQNFILPPYNHNWQAYQPPLYYILAALVFKSGQLIGLLKEQSYTLLSWFSIFLQMIFLSVSAKAFLKWFGEPDILPANIISTGKKGGGKNILAAVIKPGNLAVLSLALLSFWPSGIIHSARIGNDVLFYPLAAAAIWFLSAWYTSKRWKELVLTFVFATLALITKGNALILFMTVYLLVAQRWVQSRFNLAFLGKTALISLIFFAGVGITFQDSFENLIRGANKNFLVPNVDTLQYVHVGNRAENYLLMDLKDYFTEPYVSPYADQGGRQYFWNYLLKTSLLGEFSFGEDLAKWLALIMAPLLLLMIVFSCIGNGLLSNQLSIKRLDILLYLLLSLLCAVAFRINVPASCSNDFRYIFPVLIPFCFFYIRGLAAFVKTGYEKTAWAGLIMAGLFITTTVIFYIDVFMREG